MKFLKCMFGFHEIKWKRVLTESLKEPKKEKVCANLGTCINCGTQILEYTKKENDDVSK